MLTSKNYRFFILCSAVLLSMSLILGPLSAIQAQAATEVIQKTGQGDSLDPADASQAPPTKPFTTSREAKPAGTFPTGIERANPPYIDVVNYAVYVAEKVPGESIILDCMLSQKEDRDTLDRLADKIYVDNHLGRYQKVLINWHVGTNPDTKSIWAQTTMKTTNVPVDEYTLVFVNVPN